MKWAPGEIPPGGFSRTTLPWSGRMVKWSSFLPDHVLLTHETVGARVRVTLTNVGAAAVVVPEGELEC